jgi:hypothetical protein
MRCRISYLMWLLFQLPYLWEVSYGNHITPEVKTALLQNVDVSKLLNIIGL